MDKFYIGNAKNIKFSLEILFGKHKLNFSAKRISYSSNMVVWYTLFLIQGLLTILT